MVPGLVAFTASAPLVEITVPVLNAHAASGPLIENVLPILGCSGNTAEKKEKKGDESEENMSPAKQVLVAIKTNLVRTCVEMFVEIK